MKSNNSPKSQTSIDDLVAFIAKSVRDLHEKSGQRMDGSLLAYNVRSEYPGIDFTQLGLMRLGDAVRIAETRNLVIRHHDVQHLQLSPPDVTSNAQVVDEPPVVHEHRYVRNDIWRAFIFRSRSAIFLDGEELKLMEIPEENLKAAAAMRKNDKYHEIERISDDTQISWAKEYILLSTNSEECSDEQAKSLLFKKSNKHSEAYFRSWKAYLSSKVVDYIKNWAAKNDVPTDQILVPTKKRNELKRYEATSDDSPAIRQAIIAAIKEMPLSDLDELAIPIKYIRRHLTAK